MISEGSFDNPSSEMLGRTHVCWMRQRTVPGTKSIVLTFDDFLVGMEQCGQRITAVDDLPQAATRCGLRKGLGGSRLFESPQRHGRGHRVIYHFSKTRLPVIG
jgi:hypothetical protein